MLLLLLRYDDLAYVYHGLRNAAFQDQYVASLYFMFTTLSTTGYGDMVPVDDYERIVLCFIMMLAGDRSMRAIMSISYWLIELIIVLLLLLILIIVCMYVFIF